MAIAERNKISLAAAIIINLNVMVGAGIFINTVLLSQQAGALGAGTYLLVGIIMLPLLFSFAQLAHFYKGGNFYDYGAAIHPAMGFASLLSYFVANQASSALAVHVCMSLMQTIFPVLKVIPTLVLDAAAIALFALFNIHNVQVGKRLQLGFMITKIVPILFVIILGLYLFDPSYFGRQFMEPAGIVGTVPFVLYAFMGFEATCSLTRLLHNPEQNGPRAMLIAYGLGVLIVTTFQTAIYGALGPQLAALGSYLYAIPELVDGLGNFTTPAYILLHAGVAVSALGSAYGVMYFNLWNLYELGRQSKGAFAQQLTKLNEYQIPVWCVIIESALALCYLLVTIGNQIPLQQIAAFGMAIAYTVSALGLVALVRSKTKRIALIPALGVLSCCFLLGSALQNFMIYGALPGIFLLLFLLIMSIWCKKS